MNQDDVRKLAARTSAQASRLAKGAGRPAARPAEPAREAKPAAPASPGPVPFKPRQRPALKVVEGGEKPRPRLRISQAAVDRAKAKSPTRREMVAAQAMFRPYQPAPGVLPADKKAAVAMDSAVPGVTDWAGGLLMQGGWFEGQTFLGYPILAELMQRAEYRKACERLSTECTRKWIRLVSKGGDNKADRIAKIENFLQDLKLREAAQAAVFMDAGLGRAHWFLDTGDTDDPAELKKPIGNGRNEASKAKVSPDKPLRRIQVVDPTWTYAANYNASDPLKPDWLQPSTWYSMAKEVHVSRLLTFVGRPVPDLFKPAFNFGGLSLTQMMMTFVNNWTSVRQHVAKIVANFSKNGILTDLQAILAPDPDATGAATAATDGSALMRRLEYYTALADNNGLLVLNKDTEEFFQYNTPLGTLDQLMSQFLEQILLPSGMPLVVYLGLTPHGLNASSEGEMLAWESWVHAYQPHFFGDNIQRVIDLAQLSIDGQLDEEIGYEWVPLRSLTEKEQGEMRKADADRDGIYLDRGVLAPVEIRQKLAKDPNSGYTGIDAEDVPEPPDQGEGGGEEDDFADLNPDNDDGVSAKVEGGDGAVLPFAVDAEWNEADHPRAPDGKFGKGGGGSSAPPEKPKKTAFGGLYKTGATPAEAHQNTVKAVLANKKAVAGSSYRQMLLHLIKESPKHGTEAHVPALKAKLADTLMNAHDKLVKMAEASKDVGEIQKLNKMAEQAKTQADALFAESGAEPKTTTPGGKPILDTSKLTKVSGQKGSNPGGVYKDGAGNEFYVKNLKSPDHKTSEYTAAALYKLAGVGTLDYVPTDDVKSVATKFVPLDKSKVADLSPAEKKLAQQDFAVHAWLANWDAAGTGGDNIGVVKGETQPAVLDVGGSLGYRAQGEKKPFGPAVPELESMLDPAKSPDAAKLFGGMSAADKVKSASKVANVRDDDIRKAVASMGGEDALAETLIARKFNIAEANGLKVIEEQEDPEFAAKHPRNPDGTFMNTGNGEPTKPYAAQALKDQPKAAAAAAASAAAAKASVPKPTEAEIAKAKKPQALQPQYVPGYSELSTATMQAEAQKLIKIFNEKYEGKTLTDPDVLAQKVADFKSIGQVVETLKTQEAAQKAEIQKAEKQKAAAAAAALKAKADQEAKAAAEKNAAVMKDLGITEQQALGFNALVSMLGGKQADVVKAFKKYEDEAKGYGYPITGFQAAMIKNYTDGGYRQINENLRKGAWTEAEHVYVTMMNKALRAMPTYKGTVHRGSTLTLEQQQKYAQAGKVAREDAFMSTSISSPFGGNTKFVVTAIGKHGAHVKKLSLHKGEDEVVFAANTYFKITKVDGKPGGQMTVHMEEMEE